MKPFTVFVLLFYVISLQFAESTNTPILVLAVFRHGHRAPTKFYPKDPYANRTFFPIGYGGLTKKGKLMMFELGRIFRATYGNLLGEYYIPEEVYVRSTEKVRTMTSAQLVMSGLWPATKDQKWHSTLEWQPTLIYTKPIEKEDLLDFSNCEQYKFLIKKLPENPSVYASYISPYRSLIDYVNENSGFGVKDLKKLLSIYSILKSENEFGLTLPEWAQKIYPEPLRSAVARTYEYYAQEPKTQNYLPGFLLKEWINHIFEKIDNKPAAANKKMYLYSGHRDDVGAMFASLKVGRPHLPDYGSTFIAELHQQEENYFIKLRYIRSPFDRRIEDLTIPGCGILCPAQIFVQHVQHILPTASYKEMCKLGAI